MKSIVAAVAALAAGVSAIDSLRASSARGRVAAGVAFEVRIVVAQESGRPPCPIAGLLSARRARGVVLLYQ